MKYAYFPGCSIHGSSKEYEMSANAINKRLGIELVEIPDWNCCGAIDAVYAYNPTLAISLATRNLALAENMKTDVVTLCSACFFTLSRANMMLRQYTDMKDRVDKVINDAGLKYAGDVKVRHYMDILANDVGFDRIRQNVTVPLKGLKIAPYYGCLIVRPTGIHAFDDPEHPVSMDKVVEALGAEVVDYPDKTRCCGASLAITDEKVMMEMTKAPLLTAKNAQADCIVTPCPMCHFNLDAKQRDVEKHFDVEIELPVLYITQLVGLAFGLPPKELGLNRNIVSTNRVIEKVQALSHATH
ncbi:MAG TPA: CoB--CoM heterodisulfide reductase iron-sulfur subunit B family protein [Candidatus Bathyarchaeia archaeon]|nr:CoB--CoM heterodisulfide reductase iron-sulfur subunit B family protein [Candidatus Bathyarchaeia archaeon]